MKKIIAISMLTALTLTGCASVSEPEPTETASVITETAKPIATWWAEDVVIEAKLEDIFKPAVEKFPDATANSSGVKLLARSFDIFNTSTVSGYKVPLEITQANFDLSPENWLERAWEATGTGANTPLIQSVLGTRDSSIYGVISEADMQNLGLRYSNAGFKVIGKTIVDNVPLSEYAVTENIKDNSIATNNPDYLVKHLQLIVEVGTMEIHFNWNTWYNNRIAGADQTLPSGEYAPVSIAVYSKLPNS